MNESFIATIKMITGEEVLCEVMATEESGQDFFLLSNPIIVDENSQVDTQRGVVISGLIPKKWMMFANDDMTVVNKDHVVSISELDKFGIDFYNKALIAARASAPIKRKVDTQKHSGYVGKVDSFRDTLEGIYNQSPDLPKDPKES